ncbi:M23 family metallopeptidase [Pseudoduganella umbonata]|uniref:M23 family metallopeptidase n=1 Tax=Pseudoduganella umbonata TaxID=864828 RepID=A0A4P8HW85_9BURK|nr:M23 family metallopeptidase [Pseudoduganella umbonata]MBB3221811.1 murein DD-endopeptidase MepM/ murein hydrolase activator NlpD [Pseudoduganella umbonata]QCP14379.1 M23 family metallopeptidase [Pseudoduganella umbonata]
MKWLLTLLLGAALGVVGTVLWLGRDVPPTVPQETAVTPAPLPAPLPAGPTAAVPAPAPAAGAAVPAGGAGGAAGVPISSKDLPEVQPPAPVDPATTSFDIDVKPAIGPLLLPVAGVSPRELSDTFSQPRGTERQHLALDIPAPKGTPVLAVADGKITKLFTSKPGGLTVYQFDPSEKYAYYYAHLDSYAPELKEGSTIRRGQMIGYVGVTGNSDPNAPHLHFAIFELGADKKWWEGTPVNPYPYLAAVAR